MLERRHWQRAAAPGCLRVLIFPYRFIQCRHEEAAAFAACGYAKFTGRLGVCFTTTSPGAIHLLNGLYDAKLDHAPVLAITGQTESEEISSMQMVEGHTSTSWRAPIVVPQRETLEAAAELLNGQKKIVILAGLGALGATDELERLADVLAAPIIKPLLGKATAPDDSPFTTGGIGLRCSGHAQGIAAALKTQARSLVPRKGARANA